MAGIDIDLASIQELASKVRVMETGFATLYSNTGIYVYHQESQRIGKSLAEEGKGKIAGLDQLLVALREGKSFSEIQYSLALKGRRLQGLFPPVVRPDQDPWSLSVVIPMDTIGARTRALLRTIVASALLGLAVMGAMVVFLVRRIVRPIRETGLVLERYGSLDLTYDETKAWLTRSHDEIGDMARAMGTMRESLTHMVRSLHEEADRFTASAESLAALSQQSVASMEG